VGGGLTLELTVNALKDGPFGIRGRRRLESLGRSVVRLEVSGGSLVVVRFETQIGKLKSENLYDT
jgi:hypothetical protein